MDIVVIHFPACATWKKNFVFPYAFHMSALEMLSYIHILFQEAENIITPFLRSGKHREALFKVRVSQQRMKLSSCHVLITQTSHSPPFSLSDSVHLGNLISKPEMLLHRSVVETLVKDKGKSTFSLDNHLGLCSINLQCPT